VSAACNGLQGQSYKNGWSGFHTAYETFARHFADFEPVLFLFVAKSLWTKENLEGLLGIPLMLAIIILKAWQMIDPFITEISVIVLFK